MKVMLFIPCYNVERTIHDVLSQVAFVAHLFNDIIVVDNGSTDSTRDILQSFKNTKRMSHLRLFFNDQNYSLGGSTIIAFREAIKNNVDYVICMHGDGQANAEDLKSFFPLSLEDNFVFGNRFDKYSQVDDYSVVRLVANRFFSQIQKWIIKDSINDLGAFIAFNMHTIKQLPYERIKADMAYHPALIIYAYTHLTNMKAREFPIRWGKVETSNINVISYGIAHTIRLLQFALGKYSLTQQKLEDFKTQEV